MVISFFLSELLLRLAMKIRPCGTTPVARDR
jgi:hypothetical protein